VVGDWRRRRGHGSRSEAGGVGGGGGVTNFFKSNSNNLCIMLTKLKFFKTYKKIKNSIITK
jgi:hypothetical protein